MGRVQTTAAAKVAPLRAKQNAHIHSHGHAPCTAKPVSFFPPRLLCYPAPLISVPKPDFSVPKPDYPTPFPPSSARNGQEVGHVSYHGNACSYLFVCSPNNHFLTCSVTASSRASSIRSR